MNSKSQYQTKQKAALLQYLQEQPGKHLTAAEIGAYLKEQGYAIGQSTIYRQLERLVDEGVINKYTIDAGSPACFEYVPGDAHEEGEVCFHCKCEECGKLIHLHCEEMEEIRSHVLKEHRFFVDPVRTVFYGICEDCGKQKKAATKKLTK